MIELHNIDCMEAMREMPDKAFDLAIVDPPYGIGMHKQGAALFGETSTAVHSKTGDKRIVKRGRYTVKEWDKEPATEEYFLQLLRVSKHQIIWGANHFIDRVPFASPCWIVWDKVNNTTTQSDAELAWTSFPTAVRIFQFMWSGMMQGRSMFNGTVQQGNKSLNETRIHPTQKPVELYKWLLTNYAKPGWKILDTHFGSLSIGIACHELGYDLTAFEIDHEYFEGGKTRLEEHQRQGKLVYV